MLSMHSCLSGLPLTKEAASIYMQCSKTGRWSPPPGRETMFTSLILAKIKAYFTYRATVRELSRLTDRELDDIGVARFQIEGLARRGLIA